MDNLHNALVGLIDASIYGMILVDETERLVVWNQWLVDKAKIEKNQAIGKTFVTLFPNLENARIHKSIQACLKSGSSALISHKFSSIQFPLWSKSKQLKEEAIKQVIYVKPVFIDNIRYAYVQIEDITAAYHREKQLTELTLRAEEGRRQAEILSKVKTGIVSTVSHELRTPLTSIKGALKLVDGGLAGTINKAAADLIKIADNNTERLLLLVNDILHIEKMNANVLAFDFRNVVIQPLIENAIENSQTYACQFGVRFVLKNSLPDAVVLGDPDRLMQVMTNLLSNAAKFSHEGSEVIVSLERLPEFIRILVQDKGVGIPEEFQPHLFDEFTQGSHYHKRKIGGTGLGMSIAKKIVDAHKGKLWFQSEMGKGTSFFLDLKEVQAGQGFGS